MFTESAMHHRRVIPLMMLGLTSACADRKSDPPDLKFDALEISSVLDREKADDLFADYRQFPWTSSSDAHYLKDIGKRTTEFLITEPTLDELRSAFKNIGGRKAEWG